MHQIELALKRGKPVVIYEPQPNTIYYEAFKRYVAKGAIPFKTLKELENLIENIDSRISD